MPSRGRLDELIAIAESGNHARAIERCYTEDSGVQEWSGDKVFRERFFYDPTKIVT